MASPDRDLLLEFVAWCSERPETTAIFTAEWNGLGEQADEARYTVNRFLADQGIACDDFAPDTLAPDKHMRDVCTTCYFRGSEHG